MPPRSEISGAGFSLCHARALTALGLTDDQARTQASAQLARSLKHLERLRGGEPQGDVGPVGFLGLPQQSADSLASLRAHAAKLRADPSVQQVVWVGLGGSVLGPQLLVGALGDDALPIHFVDTLDPQAFARQIAVLPPAQTHYVLASKSGSTAETLLLGGWILQLLAEADLPLAEHVTVITGASGPLADLGVPRFDVPQDIGGRWSVLTPIGLLAAALAGVEIEGLLAGAREVDAQLCSADCAPVLGAWFYGEALRAGRTVFPFVVYDQRLALFGDWAAQLLMESLGKRVDRTGNEVRRGLTVVAARGTGAQHSMLQEWMEGPADKFFTFLVSEDGPAGPPLGPPLSTHPASLGLAGHTPRDVQQALFQGTADALMASGSPSLSLSLARVDGPGLGALIFYLELVCALMADQLDLCAYDQPGVEGGKQRARELLRQKLADSQDPR